MLSRDVHAPMLGATQLLKRIPLAFFGIAAVVATSGCVVAPVQPRPIMVAPQPVYVAPAYAAPGVGWIWEFHPRYGWGWRHPQYGWHQGWR